MLHDGVRKVKLVYKMFLKRVYFVSKDNFLILFSLFSLVNRRYHSIHLFKVF